MAEYLMTKLCKYIIIFLLLTCSLSSQYEFDISGYIYVLPTYQRLSNSVDFLYPENDIDKDVWLGLTKVRLRPVFYLWEDARIEAASETIFEYSKFDNPLFTDNTFYSRHAVKMEWIISDTENFKIVELIDRLFFKQTFDDFEFTLGRQRINWGVGRIWQPTDLLHPINPANYAKIEKTGADALSFKYFFGSFTDAEIIVNFQEQFKYYNYALRLRTNFTPFDVSAILGYFDNDPNMGFDLTGNVFDAGVRAEGIYIYDSEQPDSSFVRFIVGADYQFNSDIYSLLEFQYNGEGTTCKYCYDLYKFYSGQMMNLGMYYLAALLNWQVHPLITVSGNLMQNLNDLSGYVSPIIMYSALDNLSINLGGLFSYGSEYSEFWYYPSISAYLTVQYFF